MSAKLLVKIDKIDKKIDMLSSKVSNHDKRFDNISKKLLAHDKRFDDHDEKFDRMMKKLLENDQELINGRNELHEAIRNFRDEILSAIDAFAKKTIDFETEQLSLGKIVIRHEADIIKIKKVLKTT